MSAKVQLLFLQKRSMLKLLKYYFAQGYRSGQRGYRPNAKKLPQIWKRLSTSIRILKSSVSQECTICSICLGFPLIHKVMTLHHHVFKMWEMCVPWVHFIVEFIVSVLDLALKSSKNYSGFCTVKKVRLDVCKYVSKLQWANKKFDMWTLSPAEYLPDKYKTSPHGCNVFQIPSSILEMLHQYSLWFWTDCSFALRGYKSF